MKWCIPHQIAQTLYYEVKWCTDIESDFNHLIDSLLTDHNKTKRVLVYCKSLNTVADIFAHFHYTLGKKSFNPPEADPISDNRLFAMYHANTSPHNKDVVQKSLQDPDGVVRIVFATVALGMGVKMSIQYGTMGPHHH